MTQQHPFDERFLKKLRLLEVDFRRSQSQNAEGSLSSMQLGGRGEFSDHRTYTPGDDTRYLDWNVYARTDRFFTKQFHKRQQHRMAILLDASASMSCGTPSKYSFGAQVAAAIAFVTLAGENMVSIATFAANRIRWSGTAHSHSDFPLVLNTLETTEAKGRTSLQQGIRELITRHPRPCLVVLLSDLLDEQDARRKLGALAAKGFEIDVIHVLSPEEIDPSICGNHVLRDIETQDTLMLSIDPRLQSLYSRELNKFVDGWRNFCDSHHMLYFLASTSTPFERLIFDCFRRGGLLK